MPQPEHVEVDVYLVVKPKWSQYHTDGQGRPILEGGTVDKATAKRPKVLPREGGIVTRLRLRVDAAALLPLQPEAVVHIRAGEVDLIEVEASDPRTED